MSHTTAINSIEITDVDALRSAVQELKTNGVDCELLENAIPRAYYRNQLPQADLVLKLNKSAYDVGFYAKENGTGYITKCDFFQGDIAKQLGTNDVREGEDPVQARLGKLYQTYAVHATSRAAAQQGHTVQRINKADGTVQLVVTGV
jgi:hypothetical protein